MLSNALIAHRLGAISDVTVAGAVSTGTHGTGKDFPAIYRYVSAIELLTLPFLLFSPIPSLPSPPLPLPSFSLEVWPLNPARGSGERCKLPQRGRN